MQCPLLLSSSFGSGQLSCPGQLCWPEEAASASQFGKHGGLAGAYIQPGFLQVGVGFVVVNASGRPPTVNFEQTELTRMSEMGMCTGYRIRLSGEIKASRAIAVRKATLEALPDIRDAIACLL